MTRVIYQGAPSIFFENESDNDFNEYIFYNNSICRLNKEISKVLYSMNDDEEDGELSEEEEAINSNKRIESAFPNLSPIFCNYQTPQNIHQKELSVDSSTTLSSSTSTESSLSISPISTCQKIFEPKKQKIFSLYHNLTKHDQHINNSTFYYNSSTKYHYSRDGSKNTIYLDRIIAGLDKRTTLMIRHIPNKYTLKSITDEINHRFKYKYNVFYLPIDYTNSCNLGFAFINFLNPLYIVDFYEQFRGRKWQKFLSEKRCELAYAKIQGKSNLMVHFEKGTVLNSQTSDKKPLILNIYEPYPKVTLSIAHKSLFDKIYPKAKYHIDNNYLIIDHFCN